jgi:flagellar hook assembly protein FlgD
VYDARGRLVSTLLESYITAGKHSVTWNGRNDAGVSVGSGVYFIRLQAGAQFLSRTVNLLK